MKSYDTLILDNGSLDLMLADDVFGVRGEEVYDRRIETGRFVGWLLTQDLIASEYRAALHDPTLDLATARYFAMLHVACSIFEDLDWRLSWEFLSSSRHIAAQVARMGSRQGQRCVVVSGDHRLLAILDSQVDVFLLDSAYSGDLWTRDRYALEYGFSPSLHGLYSALIGDFSLLVPPVLRDEEARSLLSEHSCLESVLAGVSGHLPDAILEHWHANEGLFVV